MRTYNKLLLAGVAVALAACTQSTGTTNTAASSSSSSVADVSAMSSSASSVSMSSSSSTSTAAMATSSSGKWVWDGAVLSGKHTVVLKTSKGDITIELDADAAPKTATNFKALAGSGYYDGLTFHRVIPGFMIQGGDPAGNGTGGRSIFGETFEDEIDATSALYRTGYKAGVVAMANRGPNTNGSQFFIMDADYPLDPNYTIFGRVTKGQDVVHSIATTDRDASNDMPKTAVTFSVVIVK